MQVSRMAIAILTVVILSVHAWAQVPQFGGNLDVMRSRIGDERVQRQSEVSRLERLMEAFETRLSRMERQQLRASRLPAITIAEAEATLEFAMAQLKETEYRLERGDATEAQVASDRLALVRARGQLDAATFAHQESILALQIDMVYAERQLLAMRSEREITERLAAKGYASTELLQTLILNESLAEKELQLARLRLQAHQKSTGSNVPPSPDPQPPSVPEASAAPTVPAPTVPASTVPTTTTDR